nr:hypothetical protein CFP56_54584 [Quercus suber]
MTRCRVGGKLYLKLQIYLVGITSVVAAILTQNTGSEKIRESRVTLDKLFKRIQCKNLTYMNFNFNQYIRELPDLLKSLRKLILQFGRNLGLSPNMKCSGLPLQVRRN